MFNVCPNCGIYDDEKIIDPRGPFAVCPHCGHHHRFRQLPLFVVTGASGAGKTTLALHLANILHECVCLESDILWRTEFDTPEDDYRSYRNMWLRVAKNVGQNGRPVVLCGTATPAQFEGCPERRYFTGLHYLALVCDDEALIRRLRDRPAWRNAGTPQFVQAMLDFNRWLQKNASSAEPPMTLLDTTDVSIDHSVAQTARWVRDHLSGVARR